MTTGPEKTAERRCLDGVCNPQRSEGLVTSASGDHVLVSLRGPGVFLGAAVVKQGGDSGLTFVTLDIDGRNVTNISFAAAGNAGLTQPNPFGLALLTGSDLTNLTIGFPSPLRYARALTLAVSINEGGVAQVLANVIHGS